MVRFSFVSSLLLTESSENFDISSEELFPLLFLRPSSTEDSSEVIFLFAPLSSLRQKESLPFCPALPLEIGYNLFTKKLFLFLALVF